MVRGQLVYAQNVGAVIGRPQNPVFLPRHNRGENKISALCQGKATGTKKGGFT